MVSLHIGWASGQTDGHLPERRGGAPWPGAGTLGTRSEYAREQPCALAGQILPHPVRLGQLAPDYRSACRGSSMTDRTHTIRVTNNCGKRYTTIFSADHG